MTQELIARFENMSDREILISVCSKVDFLQGSFELKVEQVEERIDRHSTENESRMRQDKVDKEKSNASILANKDAINLLDKRISTIENRRDTLWETIKNYGALIGYGSGIVVLINKFKNP